MCDVCKNCVWRLQRMGVTLIENRCGVFRECVTFYKYCVTFIVYRDVVTFTETVCDVYGYLTVLVVMYILI